MRLVQAHDVPAMLRYLRDNQAHLQPFEPTWADDCCTEDFWLARVRLNHDEFAAGTSLRLGIFDRDTPARLLGTINISQIHRGPFDACYLGYGLAADAQGHGLMDEAARRVIRHVFDDMKLHRIMANYMPHNVRSGRLLRRLGFVVEGYARDYLRIAGRWEDHVLTSLTAPQP